MLSTSERPLARATFEFPNKQMRTLHSAWCSLIEKNCCSASGERKLWGTVDGIHDGPILAPSLINVEATLLPNSQLRIPKG